MRNSKFFTIIAFFLLLGIICSCQKTESPKPKGNSEKQNESIYQTPTDYYKSLFTPNNVKDLEKRVFTGMTIMEHLGKTYVYQLPDGRQIEVAYSNKNNPLLFCIETIFNVGETHFELRNDLEILKIREMGYFLMAFLSPDGLFHILELNNDTLTSISNFMNKYGGTLNNKELLKTDEAMQKQAEEFCRQFFETKYKPYKEKVKTDDVYRIYMKALKKED